MGIKFDASGKILFTPGGKVSFGCPGPHGCCPQNVPNQITATITGSWGNKGNCPGCTTVGGVYLLTWDPQLSAWAFRPSGDYCAPGYRLQVMAACQNNANPPRWIVGLDIYESWSNYDFDGAWWKYDIDAGHPCWNPPFDLTWQDNHAPGDPTVPNDYHRIGQSFCTGMLGSCTLNV